MVLRRESVKGKKALGIIETFGLVAAIEAADTAVKAANVKLIGYELARGGLTTIKVVGDVGSVKASMSAANTAASKVGKVVATHIIPRPHDEVEIFMKFDKYNKDSRKKQNNKYKKEEKESNSLEDKSESEMISENQYTCNLCEDPLCPRRKGDPRINCIHYQEEDF